MTTAIRPRRTTGTRKGAYAGGASTNGANALQVDFDDVFADVEADVDAPPARTGRKAGGKAAGKTTARAGTSVKEVAPEPVTRRRTRRAPWVSDATAMAEPAPLPIALPRAPFLLLMVGLVVVGVLGVLVLNTKINENSFRLNDLRTTQAGLDLQEQQLARNLADLESPGNLRAAATRLGLVPAGTPAFINLPDGRVVGVPQPAAGR
jgi:hypothetical protein